MHFTMNLSHRTDLCDLVPSEFHLGQNYPNPFTEKTAMKFCVAHRTRMKLEVFNAEGLRVETLLDEEKDAWTYEIGFCARGGSARSGDLCETSEGIYVYRIQAGDFSETREMKLLGRKKRH